MPQISREELRTLARDKFGRELTDAELPLPSLAQVADRLSQWQSQLGDTEPATTFYILPKGGSK